MLLPGNTMMPDEKMMSEDEGDLLKGKSTEEEKLAKQALKKNNAKQVNMPMAEGNNSMLAQVVGIILGSPEFQRR